MKIGLIGNMNNNNFALLRYLLDLGADADLLLMSCDGVGALSHFAPESDTWEIARWSSHIKRIAAPNRYVSAIGNDFPWSVMFWGKHLLAAARGRAEDNLTRPPSRARLSRELAPYDRLVGSGVTPSLLRSIDRSLHIFYPYSSGVEWVGDPNTLAAMRHPSWIRRQGAKSVRARQIEGLRAAKAVVTGDAGYTTTTLEQIGVAPQMMQLPMLYKEASPQRLPDNVDAIVRKLGGYEVRFMSHTRHQWVNTGEFDAPTWDAKYSKHNDWTVRAYAEFRRQQPRIHSVLVMTEYGTDVPATKQLCYELGVSDNVLWLPQMPRIELLEVLSACDIGIGEFYSTPRMLWGGTALEIMASGKPLVQGFIFDDGEYEGLYGHSPPPLCGVRNQADVTRWLVELGTNPALRQQRGEQGRQWFDDHNGTGLARRYLDLLSA